MRKSLHTFVRKAAAALFLTAAGTLPMLADGTIPYRASFNNEQMRYSSKGEYSKIKSTEIATYGEVGAPALPVRTYRFVVPVYTGKFTVSMTLPEKASETVTLDTPVMPVQRPVKTGDLQEEKLTIDTKAYNKVYAPKAWVVDDYFIDGSNHIVTVAVMPVEYDPVASTMKYYPYVDIRLNYADVAEDEMSSRPVFTKRPDPNLDLSKIAVNGKSLSSNYPSIGNLNTTAGTYIIISPIEYISAFKELAEWKRNKGYTVKLDTLGKIIARYPNGDTISGINDDAGKLRAYLIDCFNKYGRSYVLLAGDYHTNFPIRYASTIVEADTDKANWTSPTDVYFSDMTKNWDKNNNGKYGEKMVDGVNFYPDMFVGRLLCKNAQEVENYIRKLMLYERNPGLGNLSYLSKGLVSFSNQNPFIIKNKENYYETYIKNAFNSKFATAKKLLSCEGGPYYTGSQVLAEMNTGYGFNLIAGHGEPQRIVISENDQQEINNLWALNEYDVQSHSDSFAGFDDLSDITHPSIMHTVACTTTPFDRYKNDSKEYTLGAAYTVAGLYGGVSYIGYTRPAYIFQACECAQEFINIMDDRLSIGDVALTSRYNQMSKHITSSPGDYASRLRYSLIGDPEMNVWTKTPSSFSVAISLSTIGETIFNCPDLPDAIVTVSDGKNIISQQSSLQNTSITIPDYNQCSVTFAKRGFLTKTFLNIDGCYITDERNFFMDSGTIRRISVAPGGKLTIYASGDVILDGGLTVSGRGTLEIISDGNIWIGSGKLEAKGTIRLKSRGRITVSPGFIRATGSIFNTSYIR